MIEHTPDGPRVGRQGRWADTKMLDIYRQELQAATLLADLLRVASRTSASLADASPRLLATSLRWLQAHVPPGQWPSRWILLAGREHFAGSLTDGTYG